MEDALFVLLLAFLKDPGDTFWQPFRIPWTFSFTDDPFSDPVAPPDASSLSRQVVGDEYDHFEVPDQSEIFEFGTRQHDALQQRWKDLETVLGRRGTASASFHPLTRHFFVKALSEYGVDEIMSNLSCLEATLQLKEERRRKKLTRRFAHLVADEQAAQWLEATYRLRNEYLHSLADPHQKLTWTELARARWIVATAVNNYLDFAIDHPELDRSQLLKLLEG